MMSSVAVKLPQSIVTPMVQFAVTVRVVIALMIQPAVGTTAAQAERKMTSVVLAQRMSLCVAVNMQRVAIDGVSIALSFLED
jgi:hypothetical protein